jgi:Fur family transcriptional regulator, iron response regulator
VTVKLLPLVSAPRRPTPMDACPVHTLRKRLRSVNLRPTRQRVALGWLLFAKGDRHVTAEMIYEEAKLVRANVSMATVYNTLNQFTEVGLLREIAVEGSKTYFDTNPSPHAHFLLEDTGALIDVPAVDLKGVSLPKPPKGYELDRVELVIRLKPSKTETVAAQ